MASHYPTPAQLDQFVKNLFPDPADGNKTRAENTRREILRLFEEGIGQQIPAIRHTAWAALNAITEYVDHHRPTRTADRSQASTRRLASAWFGSGARLKQRAFSLALQMPLAI